MEKFHVAGQSNGRQSKLDHLFLPSAKQLKPHKNDPHLLPPSSGIKETPVFGCPTVNIGSRQKGRLRGKNVLDVGYNKSLIIDSIKICLEDKAKIF